MNVHNMTSTLVDFAIAAVVAVALYVGIFSDATIVNFTKLGAFGSVLSALIPIAIGVALLYGLMTLFKTGKGSK